MTTDKKLRFIHLSDIHFSHRVAGFGFDPDTVMRERILDDVAEFCGRLGPATAILVSGDIAYAGERSEYENAARWLDELTVAAKCKNDAVFVCPGNHDIDQGVIQKNPLIQDGHDKIRSQTSFQDQDHELTKRLVQPAVQALFYSPLAQFNEFAARYQCSFFADRDNYAWEHDFTLNDGSTLRIRGLNTALLSGLADEEKSLFLGSRAWTLPRRSGVEYMTIAHHPPSWLADGKEAQKELEAHARVQLFGHEHDQRIQPGRDWIKLFAGSINPHRREPQWKPGYNIIEIYVEGTEERQMVVDVHAREWQPNPPMLRAIEDRNHSDLHTVRIDIGPLPDNFTRQDKVIAEEAGENAEMDGTEMTGEEKGVQSEEARFRNLVFRFFKMTLSKKNEIVGHLRLVEESDSKLTDVERFKLALVRAKEADSLDLLEEQIKKLESKI